MSDHQCSRLYAKGGGMHHVCYAVENLERELARATSLRRSDYAKAHASQLAFGGRRIAWIYTKNGFSSNIWNADRCRLSTGRRTCGRRSTGRSPLAFRSCRARLAELWRRDPGRLRQASSVAIRSVRRRLRCRNSSWRFCDLHGRADCAAPAGGSVWLRHRSHGLCRRLQRLHARDSRPLTVLLSFRSLTR